MSTKGFWLPDFITHFQQETFWEIDFAISAKFSTCHIVNGSFSPRRIEMNMRKFSDNFLKFFCVVNSLTEIRNKFDKWTQNILCRKMWRGKNGWNTFYRINQMFYMYFLQNSYSWNLSTLIWRQYSEFVYKLLIEYDEVQTTVQLTTAWPQLESLCVISVFYLKWKF